MKRRPFLGLAALPPLLAAAGAQAQKPASGGPAAGVPPVPAPEPPVIRPGTVLAFPRDFGAHPEFRTEWWYVTGALEAGGGERFGFQVTFFRSRTSVPPEHPSRFAARQLVFAHAAVTDLAAGELLHDQRIARAGFGIAEAAGGDTAVKLRDWTLARSGPVDAGRYATRVQATRFAFALECLETQPLLLQGRAGYSQKGPHPVQASHYYSKPQLAVAGRLTLGGHEREVRGRAWLDHEWSEALLDTQAVGWDWIGMNLDDGGALTAFRLRRADGSALWAGGSFRPAGGTARSFGPDEVVFEPLRRWTSPATRASYPVAWRVRTPGGAFEVHALLDAQELDSRASTGAVYWEGLSELRDVQGRRVGGGYLEMTGYAGRLRL
ncbi:lipocalin-like domain-containing protein [Caldimonas tepidiphila]|uniref:lipocalin-like domain-containing protein n=1 Tax=Caldimonas tepidiphila TaxID=2315841 RepID=UPI000E5B9F0F|nr:carotenoid 1,2-hydratase [Caldimonas tepidiphila]